MEQNKKYDAMIIGFGKAGKTMAAALAGAGKKVALIEKSANMYGGTCINVGCIPTKFLVHRSRAAGKQTDGVQRAKFFEDAVQKKNELVSKLRKKNFNKLNQNPNITVVNGSARFLSSHEIEVENENGLQRMKAEQFFINTGSRPFIPPIKGVAENPYVYTSETLLELAVMPETLVIIGGGYIGIEFASIYADFGVKVTVLQDGTVFLPREDREIAAAVEQNLQERGVTVLTGIQVESVDNEQTRAVVIAKRGKEMLSLPADAVLAATGRRPNTAGLQLEKAGVAVDKRGAVITDAHRKTTAPHIYAMGDVVGGLQFTYISLDDFRIVRSDVLGDGSYTADTRGYVPYSVFLDPPFSRIGMSEQEAIEAGYEVKTAKLEAASIPKAQVLEKPQGLLKAVIDTKTGRILGAHLFCEESHELINLIKVVMDAKLPYTVLRDMIFTHPTMGEALNDLFAV